MLNLSRRWLLATMIFAPIVSWKKAVYADAYPNLPDDIKVRAPAPDVPKPLASMSGVWEGKLTSIPATIAVTEMAADHATIWLANGAGTAVGGVAIEEKSGPKSGKYEGHYNGDTIAFDGVLPNSRAPNASVSMALNPDGTLGVAATTRIGTFKGNFNRRT